MPSPPHLITCPQISGQGSAGLPRDSLKAKALSVLYSRAKTRSEKWYISQTTR